MAFAPWSPLLLDCRALTPDSAQYTLPVIVRIELLPLQVPLSLLLVVHPWFRGVSDMHSFSLTVCAFLLAGSAWAQPERVRALPAPSIALAVEEVRLPMAARGGRPVVEARVNGKGPYRFYFDTG